MFEISAVTGLGIDELVTGMGKSVEQIRDVTEAAVSGL
jgi:hypothetical protein